MKNLLACFAALGLGLVICGDTQAQYGRGGISIGIGSGNWGIGSGGWGYGNRGWGYGSGYGYGPGYYGSGWGYGRGYGSGLYLGLNRGYYGWGGYGYPSYSYSYYPGYSYGSYPSYAYGTPIYDYGNYYSGATYGTYTTPGTYSYSSAYGPSMEQSGQQSARIEVNLPDPNANVWVNGSLTQSKGFSRQYESPPLTQGKTYRYDLKASWQQDGKTMTREKEIQVTPGQVTRVDFTKGDGELGPQGGPYGTGQTPKTPNNNPNPNPNVNPNPNPQGNPPNLPPAGNQPQNPNPTPPALDKKG